MSDIKCPICSEKIEHIEDGWCNCKNRCLGSGSIDLWLNFIRSRKALDVAVDAIKNATEYLGNQEPLVDVMAMNLYTDLSKALEQITALEQKDVK